jgi:hypothetical protein
MWKYDHYLHSKFYMPSFNGSLLIDIKSKVTQKFRVAAMLSFYSLQKIKYAEVSYLSKICYVPIFRTLH